MSHEYPAEELTACTCCGIEMPQNMMTFLDDGQVLCPDCYDRMMNSLGNLVDEPLPTYADNASTTGMSLVDALDVAIQNADRLVRHFQLIDNLPQELKTRYVAYLNSGTDPFSDIDLAYRISKLTLQNFNVISLRTASANSMKIRELAIVFVRNGQIVDHYQSAVNTGGYYDKEAPTFKNAWNKVRNKIKKDDLPLLAFDAPGTEDILREAFTENHMRNFDYYFMNVYARGFLRRDEALEEAMLCAQVAARDIPLKALLEEKFNYTPEEDLLPDPEEHVSTFAIGCGYGDDDYDVCSGCGIVFFGTMHVMPDNRFLCDSCYAKHLEKPVIPKKPQVLEEPNPYEKLVAVICVILFIVFILLLAS